ncbi:MAG: peptidoglycan DD-metalloendopeptidase family protein [Acidobacteriota bacterium]
MRKRNKSPKITLLIIPNSEAGVKKVSIRKGFIKSVLLTLLIIVLLIGVGGYKYWKSRSDLAKVEQLKHEITKKDQDLQKLQSANDKLLQLQQKYIENQQEQQKLEKILGISDSKQSNNPSRGGIGGVGHIRFQYDVDSLLVEAQSLDALYDLQKNRAKRLLDTATARLQYYRALPNHWPLSGRLTSNFGWRKSPFGRRSEFHDGLDIAASYGTSVHAAADGVIEYTGWKAGYGKLVIIKHSNGLRTWYGHNSRINVDVGDKVTKGQTISQVGSTGRSTGPHCHFMVVKSSGPSNPLLYLP